MFTRVSFYLMGVAGAAVYYLQGINTFWAAVASIIKAFFWPGILVYRLFLYLKV